MSVIDIKGNLCSCEEFPPGYYKILMKLTSYFLYFITKTTFFISISISVFFQRRTSREGLISGSSINNRVGGNSQSSINDVNTAPTGSCLGSESTDPLLQIPNELSAVLTLKRGAQLRGSSITSSPSPARNLGNVVKRGNSSTKVGNSGEENNTSSPLLQTALSLKKKRESIV